jgi:hypothetical protein
MTELSKTKGSAEAKPAAESTKTELRIPLHDPVLTLFADGCHAANVIAGCVRLDLFVEHAWSGAQGTQPMVVGRVVMPLERFEQFARGVDALLKKLKDQKATETGKAANKA